MLSTYSINQILRFIHTFYGYEIVRYEAPAVYICSTSYLLVPNNYMCIQKVVNPCQSWFKSLKCN